MNAEANEVTCQSCGAKSSAAHTFCNKCGAKLVKPQPQLEEAKGEMRRAAHESTFKSRKWLFAAIALLTVASVVLFTALVASGSALSATRRDLAEKKQTLLSTQSQLAFAESQLTAARGELEATKTELKSARATLNDMGSQLLSVQAELTKLRTTDVGLVLSAKEALGQFLSYAQSGNHKAMWDMLHPDSQETYSGQSDFESRNPIAQKYGAYLLDSSFIASGHVLESWQGYSDVPEIEVVLVQKMDPLASTIAGVLGLGFIDDLVPDMTVEGWNARLVKVGDNWKIFADRSNTLPLTPVAPSVTLTPKSPNAQGVYEFAADEFSQGLWADAAFMRNTYYNKTIQLTGKVSRLGATNNVRYVAFADTGSNDLRCYFDAIYSPALDSLKAGQVVTIQGIWEYSAYSFSLDHSTLIQY